MVAQRTFSRLGRDLALTRYTGTASSVPLDNADSWGTLDLALAASATGLTDFAVTAERSNLGQALILRLLTPLGSLAPLGHPAYGSRLYQLIGGLNTEVVRNLARLYTIEAVGQEPRVRELLNVRIETAPGSPDTIRIAFDVLPLDDDNPLSLGLEVTL